MTTKNGFIQIVSTVGGGLDSNGNPVQSQTNVGEMIPSRIQVNSDSKNGRYEDGRFTQCSYIVFVQSKIEPERIIVHVNGTEREFTVQSIQYLNMTGHTRISV